MTKPNPIWICIFLLSCLIVIVCLVGSYNRAKTIQDIKEKIDNRPEIVQNNNTNGITILFSGYLPNNGGWVTIYKYKGREYFDTLHGICVVPE